MPIPPHTIGPGEVRPGAIGGTHFYQVRNIIQIPFDDSLDSTYFLECFFQMPENVKKISKAQVWVQKKPFRMYSSAASSVTSDHAHFLAGINTPSTAIPNSGTIITADTTHTHTPTAMGNQGTLHTHTTQAPDAGGTTTTESTNHTHSQSATGGGSSHSHGGGGHTHSGYYVTGDGGEIGITVGGGHTHTINLTAGIFESGGTGDLTLYVSDDGTAPGYGAAITGPTASDITATDITSQLTVAAGDKRLKITASARMRVQVLLLLDLLVGVDPIDIGIT